MFQDFEWLYFRSPLLLNVKPPFLKVSVISDDETKPFVQLKIVKASLLIFSYSLKDTFKTPLGTLTLIN